MEKFLYWANSTSDACIIPMSRVQDYNIDNASSGTNLTVRHKKGVGSEDGVGEEVLVHVITVNTGGKVLKNIAKELRSGKQPFVVFADDVNGEYIDSDIASLTTAISLAS